jgi:hypothetical protein
MEQTKNTRPMRVMIKMRAVCDQATLESLIEGLTTLPGFGIITCEAYSVGDADAQDVLMAFDDHQLYQFERKQDAHGEYSGELIKTIDKTVQSRTGSIPPDLPRQKAGEA